MAFAGLDDISFFGPTVPPEIKKAAAILSKVESDTLQLTLNLTVNYLHGEELTAEQFTESYADSGLDRPTAVNLFTGLYSLFRLAIRKRVKPQKFKNDLGEAKIPSKMISTITDTFKSW